jgi:NAD(P)H-dependent FMN reductase
MHDIVTIAGSPSAPSRCAAILDRARERLATRGLRAAAISVRDLQPEELIWGQIDGPSIQHGLGLIEAARGVILATPVYKAAYAGVLKAFRRRSTSPEPAERWRPKGNCCGTWWSARSGRRLGLRSGARSASRWGS